MMQYIVLFFFFNDTATTEIYTLSLHDALPISGRPHRSPSKGDEPMRRSARRQRRAIKEMTEMLSFRGLQRLRSPRALPWSRSEEHTSELQSRQYLVCRLLLEKKKNTTTSYT